MRHLGQVLPFALADTACLKPPHTCLALMPYCEYANDFMIIAVPVQRDKSGSAARYHQFAQSQLRMPADKRMRGENLNGLDHKRDYSGCQFRIFAGIEVEDPLNVLPSPRGVLYLRQDLACGRFDCFP